MDASDPMQKSANQTLQAGGRPHMDCFVTAFLAMTVISSACKSFAVAVTLP
jgi:hypothetical protein